MAQGMAAEATKNGSTGWVGGFLAAGVLAVTLLAASSLGTYTIAGRQLTDMRGWPQPIGWVAQVLTVESWPTYQGVEIRWLAWALGTVALLGLAAVTRQRQPENSATGPVFRWIIGAAAVLVVLVAVRAIFSAVPEVGLAWTWQVALALLWMLGLYVWTTRLPARTVARTIALSTSSLCAISLLYCIQGRQVYPNWPTGNVLLLTTSCLAGVFLLGTWTYTEWTAAQDAGEMRDYVTCLVPGVLFVMTAVVLSMAGRRAGVLGLAVGGAFIAVMTLLRRADLSAPADPLRARRLKITMAVILLAAVAAAAVTAPRMLGGKRWESVALRVEMYKAATYTLLDNPTAALIGVGPGHLGFHLTTIMRPLHAESPRLFHGDVVDQAHSEPLQAIVELGLPLGLFYLMLPVGGLIGFAAAYRRTQDRPDRLAMLGAGAALAAALAAEATSVGMRYPDVASLVWALTGIGWACGARAGAFERLTRLPRSAVSPTGRPASRTIWSAAGVIASVVVLGFTWQSVQSSANLYQASRAWQDGRFSEADLLLSRQPRVPTSTAWMAWMYLHGRTDLVLMEQSQTDADAASWQAKAVTALSTLVSVCPAYQDAPVWLGKSLADLDKLKALCEDFTQYDPYDQQARLVQAGLPQASPVEQLQALRLGMRNACVTGLLAEKVTRVLADPAAQKMLSDWMEGTRQALQQREPAQWSDPLALETLRIAIVTAGQQGRSAEACELSNQAAALVECLATDPQRRRLETVEMEVYLDQAWFSWLTRPDTARRCLSQLDGHLMELVKGPAGSFSETMAAQFAGMLWLSMDRQSEAGYLIHKGSPGSSKEVLRRMMGLGYARLITLAGSHAGPEQIQMWSTRGKKALGEDLWKQVLEASASHAAMPWWSGVLSDG